MITVRISISEARANLRELLERANAGEEIVILRRGKEIARLVPPRLSSPRKLPSLKNFRTSLHVKGDALSIQVMRQRREDRG